MRRSCQVLVFDADDTLWETNRYFEAVIERFLDIVCREDGERAHVRAALDAIEERNARKRGHGAAVFRSSLLECFEFIQGRQATAGDRSRLDDLAAQASAHPVNAMTGVRETLAELAPRHELRLLTKGEPGEQLAKLDTSGLRDCFRDVRVVAEKSVHTYARYLRDSGLGPEGTWMVGNSPRWDIAPARAAGMNAVYIPNPHSWSLDMGAIDPRDTRVLSLAAFTQLATHF